MLLDKAQANAMEVQGLLKARFTEWRALPKVRAISLLAHIMEYCPA
ncbi:MAG TPA: hypothetical protein VJ762_00400 [Sphingobium sp.]|nr:hypothetical protein [Sphingobium sp.]